MFEGFGLKLGASVGLLNFILIVLFLVHQYLYPWFKKKLLVRKNPGNSVLSLLPNHTKLTEVATALQDHERMDEKRADEIKLALKEHGDKDEKRADDIRASLKELGEDLSDHEARLRVIEHTIK